MFDVTDGTSFGDIFYFSFFRHGIVRQVTIENISFFFILFFLRIVVEMEIGDIYILLFPLSSISVSLLLFILYFANLSFVLFSSLYFLLRYGTWDKNWKSLQNSDAPTLGKLRTLEKNLWNLKKKKNETLNIIFV